MPLTSPCTLLLPQGGAEEALSQSDSTGSTPSQLAIEKGHRLLGLHLAEYKMRQVRGRGQEGVCGPPVLSAGSALLPPGMRWSWARILSCGHLQMLLRLLTDL